MSVQPLPPDYDIRVRRLVMQVDALDNAISTAAAYAALQPVPGRVERLIGLLAEEARALALDPKYFETLDASELLSLPGGPVGGATLLEARATTAMVRAGLAEVRSPTFGFASAKSS